MPTKTKRIGFIFLIYWILLAYIVAALVWWFIALNKQNQQMTQFERQQLNATDPSYYNKLAKIRDDEKRKTAQYIGEGAIFFLLIAAGAVFIFRAVRRQLRQSQQQQNFLVAITHELKTPIAVAKLNLETLLKRKLDEGQHARLIQNTLEEANRLNALCNNLLLSSQIEAGGYNASFEEINFSQLVNSCVKDFTLRFPQRAILAKINEELFVNGDQLLLQMAINNLIDNALKYSPKESPATIILEGANKHLQLKVRDLGKGIESNEKQKIFNKFYRVGNIATRGAKGTGLGLYLTKKIIRQHHGNIFVSDNEPNGSTFTVELKTLD